MQFVDDSILILSQLINNKEYYKRILHHIDPEHFDYVLDRKIFTFIKNYSREYSEAPSPLILKSALSKLDLNVDEHVQYITEFSDLIDKREIVPLDPMLDKTEEYVKEMELKNAIEKSFSIYEGKEKEGPEAIPEIVKKALSKSIEDSHGEFYFSKEAAQKRRDAYNNPESKIRFKIDACNVATDNGITKKSLQTFVAAPNVGKTAWMISLAGDYVELGLDVLYVTCEMSEAQIGVRFDARFLNYETSKIPKLDEDLYFSKLENIEKKSGRLIVKEYPTNELTAIKLETYLDELSTKYDFKPSVVFVDYLGICSSYYLKDRGNIGTYYTKVAEEFRACAQKKDFALWTAQQMTTDALDNTDPDIKHIGYGQGIAKTADMVWFGVRTEELDSQMQMLIKQVKTRYHKERIQRFVIGFDIGYMKMHDSNNKSIPASIGVNNQHVSDEPAKAKISTAFNSINKGKKLTVV